MSKVIPSGRPFAATAAKNLRMAASEPAEAVWSFSITSSMAPCQSRSCSAASVEGDEPADLLTLSAHATATGLVVNGANANIVALDQLQSQLRDGFELLPDSIDFKPSVIFAADPQSVRFEMIASGREAAAIDRNAIVNGVRGKSVKDAVDWINQNLSLRRDPVVDLKSDLLNMGRMPMFSFRIQVDVVQ